MRLPKKLKTLSTGPRYAPRGNRGFGATAVRAGRYGRHADYLEREVDEICILPQIESKRGLENLDAIVKVDGVTGIFLGPIDLSVDMGHGHAGTG